MGATIVATKIDKAAAVATAADAVAMEIVVAATDKITATARVVIKSAAIITIVVITNNSRVFVLSDRDGKNLAASAF